MKKKIIGLLALSFLFSLTETQSQTTRVLKKTIELQMPGEEGSNGASVAWHPIQKKYYASFAGNAIYPLALFDVTGKKLSSDDLESQIDVRGLWYNPNTNLICGNGYKENGWFSYILDKNGIPEDFSILHNGQYQPSQQSVGSYNTKKDLLYFLNGIEIVVYNKYGEQLTDSTIRLSLNIDNEFLDEDEAYLEANFNTTTVVFTGILKSEFGLLNYTKPQIELYNMKSGAHTQILKLPDGAPAFNWFNFSFANGTYWLFDKDNRKWIGYK
ncbi:MAG: hypothetical protein EPO57_03975 [Chitinophagaceae bacterium]|nr:MAG: hypothetical protein EPO57_03975 [Chitinophagaceae bacterium]